jgi:GNAT superfamily N-acetyltransferase
MGSSNAAAYPRDREAEIALRDGSTVHVRPVRPEDKTAIREFLDGVSPESIGFRFFGAINLDWVTDWAIDVDYTNRFALVAETGTPKRVIAHAAYIRIQHALMGGDTDQIGAGPDRASAEIAFLVADAWQGQGISTILLAHLAAVAQQHWITTFSAQVLPSNHRMIDVFRLSGFPVEMHSTPDVIELELPTSLTDEGLAQFDERERLASVAAVRAFLEPRSVAVIGASRRRDSVGGRILHNILAGDFNGAVYAVNNPRRRTIASATAVVTFPRAWSSRLVVAAQHVRTSPVSASCGYRRCFSAGSPRRASSACAASGSCSRFAATRACESSAPTALA